MGRLLVLRLVARGDRVTIFNRGTRPDPFPTLRQIEILHGDRRTADLDHAVSGREFDAVVDFAAFEEADAARAVAIFDGRCGHYLFVSSGQIFLILADPPRAAAREDDARGATIPKPSDPVDRAEWAYGMGKRACEEVLVEAFARTGFPATRLRIPMVHGPGDPYRRVEPYLHRLLDGGPLLLPGGGDRLLRHVDAHDVAATIATLLGDPRTHGEAFHQAHDETPTLRAIVAMIASEIGATASIVDVPVAAFAARGLDPRAASPFSTRWMSFLDPGKLRGLGIGHSPFARTIARTVAATLPVLGESDPAYRRQRAGERALADGLASEGGLAR